MWWLVNKYVEWGEGNKSRVYPGSCFYFYPTLDGQVVQTVFPPFALCLSAGLQFIRCSPFQFGTDWNICAFQFEIVMAGVHAGTMLQGFGTNCPFKSQIPSLFTVKTHSRH
jgi:hypothetical protein